MARSDHEEQEDKIIHMAENVDKRGMFYLIRKMPEKLEKKFAWAFDGRSQDWSFDEKEMKRARRVMKKKGYKVKIARMNQVVMSLGEALTEFKEQKLPRLKSGFKPFDVLLNGGFVKGGIVMIGGEPGAGKSTLTNQLVMRWSKKKHRRCVYINTEEHAKQVTDRYKRLNEQQPFNKKQKKNLVLQVQKDINMVRATLRREDASVVILDSLGGFVEATGHFARGGTKILREAAGILHSYVKENNPNAIAIMTCHVTKDGRIAGPESIQHMADTVLFIQGSGRIRTIQPTKNRFGPTSGMISVAMTETGLEFEESQKVEREIKPGQQVAKLGDGWTEA
jgi:predicted ATP-dependent serine protease